MLKPIIHENRNGFNDVQNYYNPNKYDHTLGEYVEIDGSAKKSKKNTEDLSDSESSDSSNNSDSDSSDSESSYSSDDEHDDKRHSTAQKEAENNKNQSIEIKIITSNEPNKPPTIEIVNPHPAQQNNLSAKKQQKLEKKVEKLEAKVDAMKTAKKQVVIEKQNKVEQQIKEKIK